MYYQDDGGARKISELFEKCRRLHRVAYPNSAINFEALNVTARVDQSRILVGRGHYSDVYRGTLDKTTLIVVKVLRLPVYDETQDELYETFTLRFFRELNHWNDLKHPNVARMLGYTFNEGDIGFVSLLYPKGNLLQYLRANPDASKPDLTLNVVDGLCYLHNSSKRLIHGDLKGLNVFIDENGVACIGDFGISKQVGDLNRSTGFTTAGGAGTTQWMAPELLQGAVASLASDIYALAGVIIEIWCKGKSPYHYMNTGEEMNRAKRWGMFPDRQHYAEITSDPLWHTMCGCWSLNPADRPNTKAVNEDLYQQFNLCARADDNGALGPRITRSYMDNWRSSLEDPKSAIRDRKFNLFEIDTDQPSIPGGSFVVFRGRYTPGQIELAFKRPRIWIDEDSVTRKPWFQMEYVWSMLHHVHILPFLGYLDIELERHFVIPWVEQGNLSDFMKGYVQYIEGPDPQDRFRTLYESFEEGKMIQGVASGLAYIHSRGFVHGDLKGKRIFVAPDGSPLLSIPPIAKVSGTETPIEWKGMGTIPWQGPELFRGNPKTMKSDVYAFAMVIVEILTGMPPFSRVHDSMAMGVLIRGARPSFDPRSRRGVDFMPYWTLASRCWVTEVNDRPPMDMVLDQLSLIVQGRG